MEFHRRKKQTPTVPILPLIDILTILLIFFVVTTQFKKKRHTLKIDLPSVSALPTVLEVRENSVIAISKEGKFVLNTTRVERDQLLSYLVAYREIKPDARFELEQDEGATEKDELFVLETLTQAGFKYISKRVRLKGSQENDSDPELGQ
ncbi:MAG: biopolymer transport protein ExbD [Cryomorphaceae bacterium]|jgi:biopolymer transport protein ExbD